MKRLVVSLLCVLILFFAPLKASAEDTGSFENAGALYEYWSKFNFPDYITGVWSTDGGYTNLTFGVTNDEAGQEGAKQILSLVADDDTVAIAYQTYSLHYLYDIQADIEKYLEDDLGFMSVGAYFSTNRIEVDVDQERIDDPKTNAVISTLTEKYGNAVFFKFTSAKLLLTIGSANGPANSYRNQFFHSIKNQANKLTPLLYTMFAVSTICLGMLFFSEYRRRKLIVLLNNHENAIMPQSKASYSAIENAVRENCSAPSPETDTEIWNTIINGKKNDLLSN